MAVRLSLDPTGGFLSYVIGKLGDLILEEAALLRNHKEDLHWVRKELGMMQASLEDAATMEATNETIRKYIEDLRELTFWTEDVVDTLSVDLGNAKHKSFLPRLASRTSSKHDFGTDIKTLRTRVKEFGERRNTYGVKLPEAVNQTNEPQMSRTAPYAEYLADLNSRVAEVKALLDGGGSGRAVLPIVGMSGIGKTTLAKKIYNNLQSSFDYSAWVDASCGGNTTDLVRRIARDIMDLSPEVEREMEPDAFPSKLGEFLQSKKYLIVLDDVQDPTTWGQLDPILPDGDKGSRIIITAGGEEVAAPMPPYQLPPLSKEEGEILFTKNAFPGEDNPEQCYTEELRGLRDEFVRKCRGLPIAIIVLGRLLSTKDRSSSSWSGVSQKMNWERTTDEEQCLEILKLSYANLPTPLRWCFLFLAALPEVCEVSAMLLKRLWIAEGFIPQQRGKSLEQTAEEYLEDLIRRGLVHVVERAISNGSAQVCRVHNLFLQLAISLARELDFLDVWRSTSEENKDALLRRLSLTYDRNQGIGCLSLGSNNLRTLVIMDRKDWERRQGQQIEAEDKIQWPKLRKNLKLLRVFALGSRIKSLPKKLKSMANLRYLELSGDNIRELPSSLGKNLRHLQTLDVGRTKVYFLPKSIWQIKTLRHLHGSVVSTGLVKLDVNPSDDTFVELRALRSIRADSWAKNISPAMLKNLKELEIHRDSEDPDGDEYLYSTVKSRKELNVLILVGRNSSHGGRIEIDMGEIFESASYYQLHTLELSGFRVESSIIKGMPQNLKQVKLAYARIDHGLIQLLGKLLYLQLLRLCEVSIIEETMIFESGWFPKLRVLVLHGLNIEKWELKEHSLPLLEELEISQCLELEALPDGLRNITTLESLTLRGVPEEHMGEDRCNVRHIECVRIYP